MNTQNPRAEYYELLGLNKEPFSMAPDPEFFCATQTHGECLNRLEISLRLNRGLHVVIGDIGTGKTTLSRLLLERFLMYGSNYEFFLVLDPTWENSIDFLQFLKKLFRIESNTNSQVDLMNQIEHFLLDSTFNNNKRIVLIIDEGQKIRSDQIEIIRTLLNFETNNVKLIQVVIFAQPEFKELLQLHENFKDRIAFGFTVQPLGEKNTIEFIDHRLKVAGLDEDKKVFTEKAKALVYKHTKGYPRKIIVFCHHLIIDYIINGEEIINSEIVLTRMQAKEHFNV